MDKEGPSATPRGIRSLFSGEIPDDPAVPANSKDELYSLCDDPMAEPIKLINEDFEFQDNEKLRGCFIENSGFLVVGVIGLKVCKSQSLILEHCV